MQYGYQLKIAGYLSQQLHTNLALAYQGVPVCEDADRKTAWVET